MRYATRTEEIGARELGYNVVRSPKSGTTFSQGKRRVWLTRLGWQTADRIDGSYQNHKIFEDLQEALQRPL